jgi:hypothetical protein
MATVDVSIDTTDGDTITGLTVDFGAGGGPTSYGPSATISGEYTTPGLYNITAVATTAQGATLSQGALIFVQSPDQVFAPLRASASLLQSALQSGSSIRAASLFSLSAQADYQAAFAALGPLMPNAAGYLTTLTPISVGNAIAQASFPAMVNGVSGYLTIEFIKDAAGIWRVESW